MPVHPALAEAIAASPSNHLAFLVTRLGGPYSPGGFSNAFKQWGRWEAGLPTRCTGHGSRKAGAARIAENGGSVHEIAPATGHKTISEVERYTPAARRARLADTAIAKL